MATINDLINAACEIRDADQDRENTAMRVGSLLVDIIDYIGGFVSISTLQNILADYAALDSRGQVEWRQARVISLYSMGTEYDNVDGGDWTPESFPVGSVVYEKSGSNHSLRFKKTSDTTEHYPCFLNVIYINLHSLRLYTFSETEGMVELSTNATGGGGTTVTITKGGGYVDIDIIDNTPRITLSTQSIAMSGDNKTATFKVSGVNLRGPISINGNNAYFSKSPRSITPVGGVVNEATVSVTFGGTNDDTDDLTVSSPGATAQTIHVAYTAVAGPNIVVSPASLSFKAATSETDTKTVSVQGSLLDADVVVSTASPFAVSLDGTTFNSSVTIPKATAMAGATVYVRYTAGSSATTGTLTLTSDGAADKTVDLTGAVSTLTVSPQSLTFSTDQGVAVTQSFTIQGTNLTNGVTLAVTGTNASMFTLSKDTLTKAEAEAGETITVTYTPSGSGDHSGNIAVTWDGTSQNVGLSGSAAAAAALDANGRFKKGGIYYGAVSDGNGGWKNEVMVYNSQYKTNGSDSSSNKYSGVLNIPSSVTALKGSTETTFNVTGVAEYAFRGNTDITSITLPDTVTSMAPHILLGCTGLTYFNTGNGVTGLPYDFGRGLSALQELVIGDSVVNMKVNGAPYSGCSALRTVTLGSSVQYIGQLLDSNQGNGVTTIICRGESPTIPVVNPSTIYKIYNAANITVYIPSGQREYYVAAQDSRSDVIAGYSDKHIWKYFDDNGRLIEQ